MNKKIAQITSVFGIYLIVNCVVIICAITSNKLDNKYVMYGMVVFLTVSYLYLGTLKEAVKNYLLKEIKTIYDYGLLFVVVVLLSIFIWMFWSTLIDGFTQLTLLVISIRCLYKKFLNEILYNKTIKLIECINKFFDKL